MGASMSRSRKFHIALDLDGTLVYYHRSLKADTHQHFTVLNTDLKPHAPVSYALVHGAEEFLKALSMLPNVSLYFYSAGKRWRNTQLIRLMLRDIERKWPVSSFLGSKKIAHKIITSDDGYKDLRALGTHVDVRDTILVDDNDDSMSPKENILRIQSGIGSAKHSVGKLSPENDLIRALGIILEALDRATNENISLCDALFSLLKSEDDVDSFPHLIAPTPGSLCFSENFYQRGLSEMRKYNTSLGFEE